MRKRYDFLFYSSIFISILFCSFCEIASALMIKKSIKELTNEARLILTGKVASMESKWNNDKTTIYTYVTVSVSENIKGISDTEIIIRHEGGEVVDLALQVSDTPSFKIGEDVLVFLGQLRGTNHFYVNGRFQGKYSVLVDRESGENIVDDKSERGVEIRKNMLAINRISDDKLLLSDFVNYIKHIIENK